MPGQASSTIAALCYANRTEIDFGAVLGDLGEALRDNPRGALETDLRDDGFAVFDLPGLRICLDHAEADSDTPDLAVAADCARVILVTVGRAPDPDGGHPAPPERFDLRDRITELVALHAPFDHEIRLDIDGAVDEDQYDEIVERVWLATLRREATLMARPQHRTETGPEGAEPPAATARPRREERRVTRLGPVPADDGLAVFDARAEAEQAAREAAWTARTASYDAAAPAPRASPDRDRPAWLTPRVHLRRARPRPPCIALDRSPAFDGDPTGAPLVHRAATNGLNAAMVAFALPVGAALLTMALFGRESLGVSSRTTALTGAWMGITHADSVAGLLSYFT